MISNTKRKMIAMKCVVNNRAAKDCAVFCAGIVSETQIAIKEQRKKQDHQRYLKNKEKRNQLKSHHQLCAKLTLSVGDIIKVRSTRDEGIREIISFDGTKVACYKLVESFYDYFNKNYVYNYTRCVKTTNDLSSIISYIENDILIPITDRFSNI
jgi:hypothetical protein